MTFIEGVASRFYFFEDVGGSRGPDERFRAFVMAVDVGADGDDEFFQTAEKTAPDPILRQVGERSVPPC